ncbi:MAG: PQQ-binding-like beta-propeller repeat protein [Pseudomonadota bacterium]
MTSSVFGLAATAGRGVALGCAALFLAGCTAPAWLGGEDEEILEGERVSVLELSQELSPDPDVASRQIVLPAEVAIADWPQVAGNQQHLPGHRSLSNDLRRAWTISIGSGSSRNRRLVNPPIVAGGRVFAMDSAGVVSAYETENGRRAWQVRVADPEEDSTPLGGGVAYEEGVVFASTGFGEIIALDADNGGLVWRTEANGPLRAPPTVADGRLFVVTVDNQLEARETSTGELLWTHAGIVEPAGLLGGSNPAIGETAVIAGYTSGELFALRLQNGRPLWSDSLAAIRRVGALTNLADIRGAPLLEDDRVIAISQSGRMIALDLRSGERIWEQAVGGTQTPVSIGEFVFVLTNTNQLVALAGDNGLIAWVAPLPSWANPNRRRGPIVYAGPVLAGGRLIIVSSRGEAIQFSPVTGEEVGRLSLPSGSTIPPIVADGTLYVLSDNATLSAYR